MKIFYDAVTVRRDIERGENSIPVFRALISSDKGDRFYQNHGQLGFALKDKSKPNWKEAEEELTKAIEIRDRIGDIGFGLYEFNRAICRIHLGWQKDGIVQDIVTAAKDKWAQKWTFPASCRPWLNENKTVLPELGFEETQPAAGLLPN